MEDFHISTFSTGLIILVLFLNSHSVGNINIIAKNMNLSSDQQLFDKHPL